ncbi:MAG: DUF1287 domain-containing protein [Solirubrobacterales bacterium]
MKPYLHSQKVYTAADFNIVELKSNVDKDQDGVDDYSDILNGARDYISTHPKYKSKYYEGGYPDDKYGVCTDVVWRAFKSGGYNLKDLIDKDISNNLPAYKNITVPDNNIDFRRVKNLKTFFDRNAESLSTSFTEPAKWQGGDIVIFPEHIAICSDKRNSDGLPFIIHHDGLGARERNEITNYKILGHYRWSK